MIPSENSLDLPAWLEKISAGHPTEIDMGLSRVQEVWSRLKTVINPSTKPRVITVAGTNGKGSTIAVMEAGFLALGQSVGSYTSPHIHHYNERVKINGLAVTDEALIHSFEAVERARVDVSLTYFEFGTLSALYILMSADLDFILLEVGLGGRLDAVNIVDPELAIITSVDIDHVDWLGDDVEQIGLEKAGILRPDSAALFGEGLPGSCYQKAEELGVIAKTYGRDFEFSTSQMKAINSSLPLNNLALACQAISLMSGWSQDENKSDLLIDTVNQLTLPGRFQRYKKDGIELVIDVAHNPHAAANLAKFADRFRCDGKKIVAVYSSLLDKDISGVVVELASLIDAWFIAPLDVPRGASLDILRSHLYEGLTNSGVSSIEDCEKSVLSFASIEQAIREALKLKDERELVILVFGSFYVVQEAQEFLD